MSGLTTNASAQLTTPVEHRYGPEDIHSLDLYQSLESSDEPRSLLILAHGGLWQSGNKDALAELCNNIVTESKGAVACASIGYRLSQDLGGECTGSGKAAYLDQLADLVLAYAWLYQHADTLGIDSQRIFLGGHSAGGHLAQTLNLRWTQFANVCSNKQPCKPPIGFIGLEGIYDIPAWDRYDQSFWDGRFKCAARKAFGAPGPSPAACTENNGQRCWDMGSPTWLAQHAEALSISPAADMLLVHSSGDDWVDVAETENLARQVKQAWPGLNVVVKTDGSCATGQHNDMLEEPALAQCIIDFISTREQH